MVAPLELPAAARVGPRVDGPHRRGKHPLPGPGPAGPRILQRQRVRQQHPPQPVGQILFVQRARPRKLRLQRCDQVLRQHRHPVLAALALAHDQLAARELQVLHAQAQRLQQPHDDAVHQRRHQTRRARHVQQQAAHLARRQHHRQPARRSRLHHLVEPGQIDAQHMAIQVQQRRLGLVLRRRRHLPLDGQMAQELTHLQRPISAGCRLPWWTMKRRAQSTQASSVRML